MTLNRDNGGGSADLGGGGSDVTSENIVDGEIVNADVSPTAGIAPSKIAGVAVVKTDNISVLAASTSAQLAGVISDETGSGALVFATSPTLVTPALGTPASGTLTNCTGLPSAGVASTLDGKTLTDPTLVYTINAQTGTTYTPDIDDAKKIVTCSNASAIAVTIPPNSSVAYAVSSQLTFIQIGAGQVTIGQGSGVTIVSTGATPSAPALRAQYSSCTCIKTATNTWVVVGDIE